jgi:catalase-peroxidase
MSPEASRRSWQNLEKIQSDFNSLCWGWRRRSPLADLIVLGGCAAIEKAAKDGGQDVTVPFSPGRTDASQEQTDVEAFAVLEPCADGFRNYLKTKYSVSAEELLLDKAQLLTLTASELTLLVGGSGCSGPIPRVTKTVCLPINPAFSPTTFS